jgi:invasion protein IalB
MDGKRKYGSRVVSRLAAGAATLLVLAVVPAFAAQQGAPAQGGGVSQGKAVIESTPATPGVQYPAFGQFPSKVQVEQQFVYTPWTKVCTKDGPEGTNAKEVCMVESDARLETGQLAAAVIEIEPQDGSQKVLRLILPMGVRLPFGTRFTIDQGEATPVGYLMCLPNVGCFADYNMDADMVGKLKSGHSLVVQAINPGGYPISVDFPLDEFAKDHDGPATDPKVVAERQKKLQEELQRRADATRKQLEQQQQQTTQSNPGAAPAKPKN